MFCVARDGNNFNTRTRKAVNKRKFMQYKYYRVLYDINIVALQQFAECSINVHIVNVV